MYSLVLHGPHDEEEEDPVEEADERQDDEGDGLPTELVEEATKGRGHQTPKRDEGQGYAKCFRPLCLLCISKLGNPIFHNIFHNFLVKRTIFRLDTLK